MHKTDNRVYLNKRTGHGDAEMRNIFHGALREGKESLLFPRPIREVTAAAVCRIDTSHCQSRSSVSLRWRHRSDETTRLTDTLEGGFHPTGSERVQVWRCFN